MNRQRLKKVHITRISDGKVVVENGYYARDFFDRLKGLMFNDDLQDNEGLLIDHCNSIHTFFMKYPIDVVYLSAEDEVLKVSHNMKPWRIGLPVFNARKTLELKSGRANFLSKGDKLCIS
jgi:hypothetical protein